MFTDELNEGSIYKTEVTVKGTNQRWWSTQDPAKVGSHYPEGLEKRTVTKMQERAVVMIQALMDRGWALSKPQAGGRGWKWISTPTFFSSTVWSPALEFIDAKLHSECWEPSPVVEKALECFSTFKPGLPYQVHQSVFKKYKCLTNLPRKNKSSQPPQRLDNFIFIV